MNTGKFSEKPDIEVAKEVRPVSLNHGIRSDIVKLIKPKQTFPKPEEGK